jgi:hypothetical protein
LFAHVPEEEDLQRALAGTASGGHGVNLPANGA